MRYNADSQRLTDFAQLLAFADAREDQTMTWMGAVVLGLALFALAGYWVSARKGQPLLEIMARWARILAISLGGTYLIVFFGWSNAGPKTIWSMTLFFFLGCFLFETIGTWLRVRLFSYENTPLFPRYSRNEEDDKWPTISTFIVLREWIREQGFRQTEALLAHPVPEICIREFHFDSPDGTIRFTVSFVPKGSTHLYASFAVSSVTEEGARYLTDNTFVPQGGCFPDNWVLDRKPLSRSPHKLLKRHKARMAASGKNFVQWEDSPMEDIGEQHRLLERENEKKGMLNPRIKWEKHGRFSQEGRYRLWKEIFLLNYLGIASP